MKDVQFCYVKKNNGVATVAYKVLNKQTVEGSEHFVVEYAAAFCSPKDQFNKRLGRAIATGRLRKSKQSIDSTLLVKDEPKSGKFAQIARALNVVLNDSESTAPGWWA
jgi:hypothetical protein